MVTERDSGRSSQRLKNSSLVRHPFEELPSQVVRTSDDEAIYSAACSAQGNNGQIYIEIEIENHC